VASGGQLGLLGNRGVLDTPFKQTNSTRELVEIPQARTDDSGQNSGSL
jgi:iron complex outermembrane receptor protein